MGSAGYHRKRARRPHSRRARTALGPVSGLTCDRLRRDPPAAQERLGRAEAGWVVLLGPVWDG